MIRFMHVFIFQDTLKHAKLKKTEVTKKSQKVYDEKINIT